jgi:hypothetical protein
MASFNLENYVTVEQLKEQFFAQYPDGRIVTQNLTSDQDRQVSTWVVVAAVFLSADEQERNLPKATGHAFEIDGVNGTANKFSALENCESSAIGRALRNCGFGKTPTREEMSKVARGEARQATVSKSVDWVAKLNSIDDVEGLRSLYIDAKQSKAASSILEQIKAKADGLGQAG